MTVLAYPMAAAPGEARLWVGVTNCTKTPNVHFELDGAAHVPTAVRAMTSVRGGDLLTHESQPRVFSGVYKFSGLDSHGASHSVRVRIGRDSAQATLASIPESIPRDGLHVMLTSCFHVDEAGPGAVWRAVSALKQQCGLRKRPHFSLLMGDQVYLDLPIFKNYPKAKRPLAQILEAIYLRNWIGEQRGKHFDQILSAGPFLAMSDDHEFWNNFPHLSPIIQNSWTETGHANWTKAAKAMFSGFQACDPDSPARPIRIDLAEVSFLAIDTRIERSAEDNTFLPKGGLADLTAWVDDLNRRRQIGVLVTGQSLYSDSAGIVTGAIYDYEFPNYDDFDDVMQQLVRVRSPLICLTGDVHWGRVVQSRSRNPARRGNVFEVITSPSALVTTAGKDSARGAFHSVTSFFGRANKWPRHSNPKERDLVPRAFANRTVWPTPYDHSVMRGRDRLRRNRPALIQGDQIALLTFETVGARRISAGVQYWSLDNQTHGPVMTVPLFDYARPHT